jgi:hypothetical protein
MGEPATPTPADRKDTRTKATKILESVRNDEVMPLPIDLDDHIAVGYHREDVELLAFNQAQEIVLLRVDLAEACRLAREGFSRGWDGMDRRDAEKKIAELERSVR